MQYLLLIYEAESLQAARSDAENQADLEAYLAFTAKTKADGVFIAGDALLPTSTATSVRKRDGKVVTTDGPFAETKEQLGGYYVIEAKDLDEAIERAAQIPAAVTGTVEVRPIMTFDA